MNDDMDLVILVTPFQNDTYEIQTLDNIHGIIEYTESEGTYQDHWVQLLALRRTSQESHHSCSVYSNITPNLLSLHTGIPVLRAQP